MVQTKQKQILSFLVAVAFYHVITYFIFGFIASSLFNYQALFEMPVIKEYYKPFGSLSSLLGPLIQVIRGLIIGLVILPFRKIIAESKIGWFYLWTLFVGIGIIATPAAAPSSVEGFVYSKLPVWFHLIGFPEILMQTLLFSLLVYNKIGVYRLISSQKAKLLIQALSTACISFIGYTIVSIGFAVAAKAKISESSAHLAVLGQFGIPLILAFIVALLSNKLFIIKHVLSYFLSVSSIFLYQLLVLGEGNFFYSIIAPIIPVTISMLILKQKKV